MNWASDLTSEILGYLTTKDIARWRQTAGQCMQDTEYFLQRHQIDWYPYISYTYITRKCSKCPAIRSFVNVEWCPYCESNVCVEHLERCTSCDTICCSECAPVCDCG